MNQKIINRLFDYTHLKKVNDSELSEILESDRPYVSRIKSGKKRLTFEKFELIYTTFHDLDLNWLFRGKPLESETTDIVNAYFNSGTQTKNEVVQATLQTENRYLKDLIKEKEKQIELLQRLVQ